MSNHQAFLNLLEQFGLSEYVHDLLAVMEEHGPNSIQVKQELDDIGCRLAQQGITLPEPTRT